MVAGPIIELLAVINRGSHYFVTALLRDGFIYIILKNDLVCRSLILFQFYNKHDSKHDNNDLI